MKLNEYEVIYIRRSENTVYVCRKASESGLYRIIEASDKTRIAKYIKYFKTRRPREFRGDFSLNEKYYAVFDAPDGIPLKKSGETLTARKAVRALAMQDPPLEIAVKMLSPDNIFVCGDELEFAFVLPETEIKITRGYFFTKLADFINSFCETNSDRNIEMWLDELRRGKFENILTAYRTMPDTAAEPDLSDEDRFKKVRSVLSWVIAVITAAAAIISVAALMLDIGDEKTEYSRIDSLGTIELRTLIRSRFHSEGKTAQNHENNGVISCPKSFLTR